MPTFLPEARDRLKDMCDYAESEISKIVEKYRTYMAPSGMHFPDTTFLSGALHNVFDEYGWDWYSIGETSRNRVSLIAEMLYEAYLDHTGGWIPDANEEVQSFLEELLVVEYQKSSKEDRYSEIDSAAKQAEFDSGLTAQQVVGVLDTAKEKEKTYTTVSPDGGMETTVERTVVGTPGTPEEDTGVPDSGYVPDGYPGGYPVPEEEGFDMKWIAIGAAGLAAFILLKG